MGPQQPIGSLKASAQVGQGRAGAGWAQEPARQPSSQLSWAHRVEQTGNAEFCTEVAKWAFHQRGMLRVSNVHHNKAGSAEQPDWYRITDDLDFALDIHELSDGAWKPYRCAAIQALRVSSGQFQALLCCLRFLTVRILLGLLGSRYLPCILMTVRTCPAWLLASSGARVLIRSCSALLACKQMPHAPACSM